MLWSLVDSTARGSGGEVIRAVAIVHDFKPIPN
jgi:hypothetical protein